MSLTETLLLSPSPCTALGKGVVILLHCGDLNVKSDRMKPTKLAASFIGFIFKLGEERERKAPCCVHSTFLKGRHYSWFVRCMRGTVWYHVRRAKLFGPGKQLLGHAVRPCLILISRGCPVCGKQHVRQIAGSCTAVQDGRFPEKPEIQDSSFFRVL